MKNIFYKNLFWIGFALLVIDLFSYWSEIKLYFTELGITLLFISIILIVLGYLKTRRG